MQAPYFERLPNPQNVIDADRELLELGEKALPVLVRLFSGEARNAFWVQYRQLDRRLRCAIEIAARLGPEAKPLEPYLREEVSRLRWWRIQRSDRAASAFAGAAVWYDRRQS